MNGELMRQAETVFGEVVDLPGDQRASILAQRCAGNQRLRSWVERLLEIDDSDAEGLLHRSPCPGGPDDLVPLDEHVPSHVGSYEVLRRIGAGGMGVVYEARQRSPRRTVALKVVRSMWPSREALRRFRHECQILGRLQHPGIAQIHEADVAEVTTSVGATIRQPFFAMEFVRGQRLDRHARDGGLNIRERLELVARLCEAVQYAHLKGVVHRDLKPGNILVDEHGQPKVLDFGVARATCPDAPGHATRTDMGQLIGTLSYMCPEQVQGDPGQVDLRADVYALGVILYELLAGRLPLDVRDRSIPEAARIIREDRPPPISSIVPALRGDIQTICHKALEKDNTRRYQSAGELGDDLRRYLRGQPINARRDSAVYMLRRTLHRYRWPTAALGLFVGLTVAFAAYAMGQAQRYRALALRAGRASQEAETAAARAAAVKTFLQDMLAAADPSRAGGRNVTVREVLDNASERIAAGLLAGQPPVEAEVRATIAHTYFNLGLNNAAIPHFDWIHAHREREFGAAARETLEALCWLGRAHLEAPAPEQALSVFERSLDLALGAFGPNDEISLEAMDGLGAALTRIRRADEAEALHRDALESVQRHYGEAHEVFVSTSLHLGQVYTTQRRFEEAERLYLRALAVAERLHGRDARVTIRLRWQLASEIYAQTDRIDQAVDLLSETLADARTALGPQHTETLVVLTRLGRVLDRADRPDDAERLLRAAVAEVTEVRAGEDHDTIRVVGELARLLSRRDRGDEAVALLRDGLQQARSRPGSHPRVLTGWMAQLAWMEADRGEPVAAAAVEREVLALRETWLGPRHALVGTSLYRLGSYLDARVSYGIGPVDECIAVRREALAVFRTARGEADPTTIDATIALAWGLMMQRDYDATADLLNERLGHVRDQLGDLHPRTQRVASYLASLAQFEGREHDAARLCRRWLDRLRAEEPDNHIDRGRWALRLAISLHLARDYPAAVEACREAIDQFAAADRPESVAIVQAQLAETLVARGQIDEAVTLSADAATVLATIRKQDQVYRWGAERTHASALLARGDLASAETRLRTCIAAVQEMPFSLTIRQRQVGLARTTLGTCLVRQGRFAEAEQELLGALDQLTAACGERHDYLRSVRAALAELYETRDQADLATPPAPLGPRTSP